MGVRDCFFKKAVEGGVIFLMGCVWVGGALTLKKFVGIVFLIVRNGEQT